MIVTLIAGLSAAVLARAAPDPVAAEPALAARVAEAAQRFLSALTPAQRGRAQLAFTSDERLRWHYVPMARRGLPLGALDDAQRALAHGLIAAALGPRGYAKATGIIALEDVLRRRERNPGRDPGAYFVSVFGEPSTTATWSLRLEGHHLSIHLTLVDGVRLVEAPAFLGASPSTVPIAGSRVLGQEEDLGFRLLAALDPAQRQAAVYQASAPADILTGPGDKLTALPGLTADRMTPPQRTLFDAIVDEVTATMPRELADRERARIAAQPASALVFTWAGGAVAGKPHYFRLAGPSFVYELDNTQSGATHIHSVWHARDPAGGDFGVDLLRAHRARAHAAPAAPAAPE